MIKIGETISKIRKEKNLTQEQLSEVFGVSVAAVSKWETGIAYPDIELLPKIADFFDISIDLLLGYDMSKTKLSTSEHLDKAEELFSGEGKEKEAITYLGNLVYRYPNNIKLRIKYAELKVRSAHGTPRNETHKKNFREAEEILLAINQNGLSRVEQDGLLRALYTIYLWEKKFDKAEKIINDLTPEYLWFVDRAEFWLCIHKGDFEKAKEKYYHMLRKDFTNDALTGGYYHFYYDEPEKVIDLNNKFIKMTKIFEEELCESNRLPVLYESNAFMYARLGKKDESLAEMAKFIELYGDSYESFMEFINCDERKEYELIKNTEEFKNMAEKLR